MGLLSFGSNGNYQLGLGHAEDVYVPTEVTFADEIKEKDPPKQIACGGNHTILLYPSGNAYACGLNRSGQCALPPCEHIKKFTKIPSPPDDGEKWLFASAGWECTMLVTTTGRIYPFGRGDRGELGLGENVVTSTALRYSPGNLSGARFIENFPPKNDPIRSISSSITHTIVCLASGRVYGWGAARKGQIGSPTTPAVWTPREIRHELDVPVGICGRDFTMLVDARTLGGRVLGKNRWDIENMPFDFYANVTDKVYPSWNGIYVHTINDEIMAWGRNDRGQIPPPSFGNIEMLAIGSEHGLCLTKDWKVMTWGWNEHGNCGVLDKEGKPVDIVAEPKEIEVPGVKGEEDETNCGRIRMLAGGCATSWIYVEERKEEGVGFGGSLVFE